MQTDPRQLSLLDPPPPIPGAVRHDDPETSKEAAESFDAGGLELQVHAYIAKHGPCILDEVATGLKIDKVTASPRFKPLAEAGMIALTGIKRPGKSGRPQQEWKVIKNS